MVKKVIGFQENKMQSAIGTTASGCGSDSDTPMQIRLSLQGAQLCIPSDCESRLIAHPICMCILPASVHHEIWLGTP